MGTTVKTKIKVAVGVVCFIVVMAIVSIIVAVAIAGMTRPTLYDKKFNSIYGATNNDFVMIDGVFAANYNGDWVLTDGNNIVSKKYRALSYWKDNLYLARLSKNEFAIVNNSGREVRSFNYSDKPLMNIDDEIYPYYIVAKGEQSSILSINDSELIVTFDKIFTLDEVGEIESGSEVYGNKGYFAYEQEGKRYLTSMANLDAKIAIEQSQTIKLHRACIEVINVGTQTVKFYSLDNFTLVGEGTALTGVILANNSYLMAVGGYMVSVVSDSANVTVDIPQLDINFSYATSLPTSSPVKNVLAQDSGNKVVVNNGGENFLYEANKKELTSISNLSKTTLADTDFISFNLDGKQRLIALTGEGDIFGEILKVKAINGDLFREYVTSGSDLFEYDKNLIGKLDFIRVTDKFVSSDGHYINCTDGTYDYRFGRLNSFVGNTTRVNKRTSCYVDESGKKIFTDLGTQRTANFDKDTFVKAVYKEYGDNKYAIYFEIYESSSYDTIINLLDFSLKPMIDNSDSRLITTPLSTIKDVRFFDDGEYAIIFNDKEMYMSYSGDFFEYGEYTNINDNMVVNDDGSVIAVVSDGELIVFRASMGRFKNKSETYFGGGVTVKSTAQNKIIFKDLQLNREGLIDEYGSISISARYSQILVSDDCIVTIDGASIFILSPNGRVLHEGIVSAAPFFINGYLLYENEFGFAVLVSPDGKVISDKITSIIRANQYRWVEEDGQMDSLDRADYNYEYYALTIGSTIQIMKFPI